MEGTKATPHYIPILKGRMGELRALNALGTQFDDTLTPLVEIPLNDTDTDSDAPEALTVAAYPRKFAADLKKRWSPHRRIIVDASLAPPSANGTPATVDLINELAAESYWITPTVRPSDSGFVLEAVRRAIGEWNLGSACIRLSGDDLDDNELPLSRSIDDVLGRLGVPPDRVDLILDFGPLLDEQAVAFASRIARLVLAEVPYAEEWRNLVCASAGFPPDLNTVQPEVLTELPRYDAVMWHSVRERVRGRVPGFGDYGIAYPTPTGGGAAFAPAPQLRFTWGPYWLVFKGRKRDRRGSAQFFDICERMIEAEVVDPELSWGDYYVARAGVEKESGRLGPGNAMIWRAIGTSHHLSYVANRLATLAVP